MCSVCSAQHTASLMSLSHNPCDSVGKTFRSKVWPVRFAALSPLAVCKFASLHPGSSLLSPSDSYTVTVSGPSRFVFFTLLLCAAVARFVCLCGVHPLEKGGGHAGRRPPAGPQRGRPPTHQKRAHSLHTLLALTLTHTAKPACSLSVERLGLQLCMHGVSINLHLSKEVIGHVCPQPRHRCLFDRFYLRCFVRTFTAAIWTRRRW